MFDEIRASEEALGVLINITDEAIFLLDEHGDIVSANDRAMESFHLEREGLSGTPITSIFYSLLYAPMPEGQFPMGLDGLSATLLARFSEDTYVTVEAHCRSFEAERQTYYLLAARNIDTLRESMVERSRLMDELTRSNKRLSGLLAIISSTLGNPEVDYLNRKILSKLADFIDADGAILYFVEGNGYRIRGVAEGTPSLAVGTYFVPKGHGVAGMVEHSRASVSVQFVNPLEGEVSEHPIAIDLGSKQRIQVDTRLNTAFGTVLGVPVFNHDSVIAIIEVGWLERRSVDKADISLLETAAEYLAVEFISAASTIAHMRMEELDQTLVEVREILDAAETIDGSTIRLINAVIRKTLPFEFLPVTIDPDTHVATIEHVTSEGTNHIPIPEEHMELITAPDSVIVIEKGSDHSRWLEEVTDLSHGVLVDLGEIDGEKTAFFVLRPSSSVPYDTEELDFIERLVDVTYERVRVNEELAQESYISQALQLGMRNDLPEVPGLTTASLYSSATRQAYIGGDFYDIFELPGDRVCVLLGDISGKGVQAASMASLVKTAVAAYAWTSATPAEVATSLDELFRNFSRVEAFVTLFISMIDLSTGIGMYCSAGHPPALLYHESVDEEGVMLGELELLTVQSPIVGAFEGMKYVNGSFTFSRDDILFLYTDGASEARGQNGGFLGEEGLREVFLSVVDEPFEDIPTNVLETIEEYSGGSLDDDVAMLAVRFDRPEE